MNHAALESKEIFSWVAVILILLNSIVRILFGQLIFKFKSNDGQTVNKYAQIKSHFACVLGIAELSCHAEDILFEVIFCRLIVFVWREIKHNKVSGINLYSVAKHSNNTAFGKLSLQTV